MSFVVLICAWMIQVRFVPTLYISSFQETFYKSSAQDVDNIINVRKLWALPHLTKHMSMCRSLKCIWGFPATAFAISESFGSIKWWCSLTDDERQESIWAKSERWLFRKILYVVTLFLSENVKSVTVDHLTRCFMMQSIVNDMQRRRMSLAHQKMRATMRLVKRISVDRAIVMTKLLDMLILEWID